MKVTTDGYKQQLVRIIEALLYIPVNTTSKLLGLKLKSIVVAWLNKIYCILYHTLTGRDRLTG